MIAEVNDGVMKTLFRASCLALALVVVSACGYKKTTDERNKTTAAIYAIHSALANYQSNFGEYPTPAKRGVIATIDGATYDVSGGLMLYQALTGDGTDGISMPGAGASSDGQVSEDERKNASLVDIPKEWTLKTPAGYVLVDGFGHPFQYAHGDSNNINSTYDLWSFADTSPTYPTDKAAKMNTVKTAKWIKNW